MRQTFPNGGTEPRPENTSKSIIHHRFDGIAAIERHRTRIAAPDLGLNAMWLDRERRKMCISIMGIARTEMITHVTEKLSKRGLNIQSGFGTPLETATGAFFEIFGANTGEMESLFNEIIQEQHERQHIEIAGNPEKTRSIFDEIINDAQDPPIISQQPLESAPIRTIHELKIIAPDRPGIVYDISKRLNDFRINIDHMVIRTKNQMGIVYSRLGIRSDQDRDAFVKSLRTIEDYRFWRIECNPWIGNPSPEDMLKNIRGENN